jgi:sigma-54 dependent transcriptional regulator, acetoin dehydrogenase operon transcriptional activator AcoR
LKHGEENEPMMTFDPLSCVMKSPDFMKTLFDAIPCGVVVVDENRRIVAANRIFENAVGLEQGGAVGHCEGEAIGCLNAGKSHNHFLPVVEDPCQTCGARHLAIKALKMGSAQKGRAHFQIKVGQRIEEITLALNAAPIDCPEGRYAIVIIEDISRLRGLNKPMEESMTLGMVGSDPQMRELFDTVRQVGPLDVPVLIQGESGTGKELVANALHEMSRRTEGLLVPVNCGALPDGLLESELFGHVKGSFTGAVRDKRGRFQLADGGTIFLDEIGELSPKMQVKFLRVLQNGTFERVGDENTLQVSARVICATNRDLESDVEAGRFRADLFYRLCVVPITVPPLRDRTGDVAELAGYFLKKVSYEADRLHPGITDEAIETLTKHRWPGNVRELENAIRYAAIKSQGVPILTKHLPPQVSAHSPAKPVPVRNRKLDENVVRDALEITKGNKSEAARHLGVSRATLYRFLSEVTLAL